MFVELKNNNGFPCMAKNWFRLKLEIMSIQHKSTVENGLWIFFIINHWPSFTQKWHCTFINLYDCITVFVDKISPTK